MCAAELEVMEPGAREGHVCTHGDLGNANVEDDNVSHAGSTSQLRSTLRRTKAKRPRIAKIKQYVDNLEEQMDIFMDTVSTLCTVLPTVEEKEAHRSHLLEWIDHAEMLKERAWDLFYRDLASLARLGEGAGL